jgi:hypothetical protein
MKQSTIRPASINAFSKKLEEWSKTLPKAERSLLRLLIDRATTVNVEDLGAFNLTARIQPDAERVFKSLKRATRKSKKMRIRLGPLWLRSTTTVPDSHKGRW